MIKWKEWMIKWTKRKNNKIKNIILSEKKMIILHSKRKNDSNKRKDELTTEWREIMIK